MSGTRHFWAFVKTQYTVAGPVYAYNAKYIVWGSENSATKFLSTTGRLDSQLYMQKRRKMDDGYKPISPGAIEKYFPEAVNDIEMFILDKVLKGELY